MEQTILITSTEDSFILGIDLLNQRDQLNLKGNNHQSISLNSNELYHQRLSISTLNSSTSNYPSNYLILSLQQDRPLLNIYGIDKDTTYLKFPLVEKMCSVEVMNSNNCSYCIMGSVSGKIYIWDLNSGVLKQVFEAHYKPVNVLKFDKDNTCLISASEDASVNVWRIAELFNPKNSSVIKPLHRWTDHSLLITDIVISCYNQRTKVITCSKDQSVNIYDLATGQLLTTFLLSTAINCICLDKKQTTIFIGGEDGNVYKLELYENKYREENIEKSNRMDQKVISIEGNNEMNQHIIKGNGNSIVKIQYDLTGSKLIIGDIKGLITIIDIQSLQIIQQYDKLNGSITSLNLIATNDQFHTNEFSNNKNNLISFLSSFQRTLDKEGDQQLKWFCNQLNEEKELDDVNMGYNGFFNKSVMNEIEENGDKFEYNTNTTILKENNILDNNNEKTQLLEKDVINLYQSYQQQKQINSSLYDLLLNKNNNSQ
ncbi:WD40 repeat-like protein [Neoconidiobolus thromboides FSU 785]|nr:WD40 repeat-like protein [Neoconidiobolus thromboides FSU 785]